MTHRPTLSVLSMSLLGVLATATAPAALLVDVNFDANNAGDNLGAKAANATGLSGNWSTPASTLAPIVTSGNLSFSDLNTGSGNRLVITHTGSANFGAAISLGSSPSGTLWYSGLFKITSASAQNTAVEMTRVNTNSSGDASDAWFRNLSRGGSSTAMAASYDNGAVTTGFTPVTGTTYMVITRYTNVASTASATASMFVLTEAQYNALVAGSGGFTESDLIAGNVTATATDTKSAGTAFGLATGNYLKFAGGGSVADDFVVEYDRIRFADSFTSVVPEPTSLALLSLGGAGLLRRRR